MGGGLVSRQMMHAPPSAAIRFQVLGFVGFDRELIGQADETESHPVWVRGSWLSRVLSNAAQKWQQGAISLLPAALLVSARPENGAGAVASSPLHALRC
jgi:hypothetical protein